MEPTTAEQMLEKYQLGTISAEEKLELESWFETLPEAQLTPDDDFHNRLKAKIDQANGQPVIRTTKLWPWMAWTSAAVVAFACCIYFFYSPNSSVDPIPSKTAVAAHDVEPGRNTATLTLANGNKIQLSDSKSGVVIGDELTYNDQTAVIRESTFELLNTNITASTPRGGTYKITLPDDTKVWLNADSRVTFPYKFAGSSREVSLQGEAYFEVSKDKTRPFFVQTKNQRIEVLGTHFNVKSYADEPEEKTTLLEGSIRVSYSGSGTRLLKPGQQAILSNREITITRPNTQADIAWKNGDFFFSGQDLKEVMRTVSRWYAVDVDYEVIPDNIRLGGEVSRTKKLSAILGVLESTGGVKFNIEGNKVTVTK